MEISELRTRVSLSIEHITTVRFPPLSPTLTWELSTLFLLHYRLVPPSLVGLTGVRRGGEPDLWVDVLIKVVYNIRLGFSSHILLASISMEMTSSIIIVLWPFDRWRDLPPGINGGIGRLNSFRYGPLDLASSDQFWIFSLDRRRRIILAVFVMVATSSTMVIRTLDSQWHRSSCPVILPWYIGVGTFADVDWLLQWLLACT
jgi:hypothetical protein